MPKRFNLTYVNKDGEKEQPVVIHRSSIGAVERTVAFLIEKYKGAFPLWLAPVQIKVLPITEKNVEYANKILKELKVHDIRTELDDRNETLQAKIRDAQVGKVPYMIILGEKEEKANKISVRDRDGKVHESTLDKFVEYVKNIVKLKALSL
jgi:threonyl-tRNA synthetase